MDWQQFCFEEEERGKNFPALIRWEQSHLLQIHCVGCAARLSIDIFIEGGLDMVPIGAMILGSAEHSAYNWWEKEKSRPEYCFRGADMLPSITSMGIEGRDENDSNNCTRASVFQWVEM